MCIAFLQNIARVSLATLCICKYNMYIYQLTCIYVHTHTLSLSLKRALSLTHTRTHPRAGRETATHCNTLQHTASNCNTLQHTATHCKATQCHSATHCNTQHTPARLQARAKEHRAEGWVRHYRSTFISDNLSAVTTRLEYSSDLILLCV